MMEKCCNICSRSFQISDSTVKEEIFIVPQIQDLMKDTNLDAQCSVGEKAAWEAFKLVVNIFLGKHKAPNYKTHVENMHKTFRNTECNMSLKLHFLHSHLVPPPHNPTATCDEHTKRNGGQQCLPTTAGNYRESPATYQRKANVK
jgi:hypothetical protein